MRDQRKRLSIRLWRTLRWVSCAAVVSALWACGVQRLAQPAAQTTTVQQKKFAQTVNHKLDILFMIDDSSSMAALQTKMAMKLPDFMTALVDPVTKNLPDLHVAVISSSLGSGAWAVDGCMPHHPGNDDGKFQQGPGGANTGDTRPCPALNAGETFLRNLDDQGAANPNYTGDIQTVFSCMALLGQDGCGFESQFASTEVALSKAQQPDDPDNGGFLRDDALLAIVMFTNEDDCSVPAGSLLFNPQRNRIDGTSNLGGLQSYRCNQFGHLCDGAPPPLNPPAAPITYTQCVSAEDNGLTEMPVEVDPRDNMPDPTLGHLTTVAEFSAFVKGLKTDKDGNPDPSKVLVAAIAGPITPYVVDSFIDTGDGNELEPEVVHSCVQPGTTPPQNADPAIRIRQWIDSFGPNGVFATICADDYSGAMMTIANAITKKLSASCVSGKVARLPMANGTPDPNGAYDCTVTEQVTDASATPPTTTDQLIPTCSAAPADTTCWQLVAGAPDCVKDDPTSLLFQVCVEGDCATTAIMSNETRNATVACALTP